MFEQNIANKGFLTALMNVLANKFPTAHIFRGLATPRKLQFRGSSSLVLFLGDSFSFVLHFIVNPLHCMVAARREI